MKKLITKIAGITAGLAMAIGACFIGANVSKEAKPVYAVPVQAFSFSRSESSDSVTEGYSMVLTNYKGNADNYQDKNSTVGLDIGIKKSSGTIWSTTPASISLTVKVGGGSAKNPLINNVTANLIDSSGNAIANTSETVTNKVVNTTGDDYTVSIPVANNAAGVMIHHTKESGYNVRVYEISLSYEPSTKKEIDLSCSDVEMDASDSPTALTVTATSEATPVLGLEYSFSIDDTAVATVSDSGVVTPVAIGETKLTISFAGDEDYNPASKIINVAVSDNSLAESTLTFAAACGGSGTADDGAVWAVTSDASESNYESDGIHYGTSSTIEVTYVQLSTSDILGNIKRVVVKARDAQESAEISVSVGNTNLTCSGSSTATNTSSNYTFRGNAKGAITVRIDRGSAKYKAIYVKSIIVDFEEVSMTGITLTGTYPTEFTQGDSFSHTGMVVTANYDDSTNEVVTGSATWTGYNMAATGEQTVTVSYTNLFGTVNRTYTITVNAPVVPTIILSVSSISGYTGEDYSVTATYSNLTSAFSWGSPTGDGSISGSVTSATGTSTNGTSTYSGKLTGAGSVVLPTSGGGVAEGPSVEFTITLSTVTITGLPASDIIGVGDNLNLGSLITVTPTGSCSNNVTWSTSEESVATVSETGVVTGVALGTTNITVTSDDYPSATMTCAITVSNKKTIDFTSGYAVAKPASAQSELSTVEINDYELNLLNCHNNNGVTYEYMMFATKQLSTGDSLISNKTPLPGYISKIVFKIKAGSAAGAVYKATLSNSEVTAKVTSSTYSRTGEGNLVITANPNDNFRYFAISCSTSGSNGQLESIDIYYREPTAKELISEIDTLASLSYSNYTKVSENNYTFTDLCIRFGGFVSQDLWDGLDNIHGYGVILSNGNDEIEDLYNAAKDEEDTVEEALAEFCDGTNIKKFYSALTQSKTHPAEATTEQKEYMGVDTGDTYYIWTLGKGVSSENLTTVYNVVAYIIFDNDIVFLNAAKESTKTLAGSLISTGAYEEDAFGGSLKYLKDLSVLP